MSKPDVNKNLFFASKLKVLSFPAISFQYVQRNLFLLNST